MLIQPFDIFVYAWLAGNPEPAVMKWGFVLMTLYMGAIGLLLYVMADKEPKPGSHGGGRISHVDRPDRRIHGGLSSLAC